MATKVLYNACYGGFSFSKEAAAALREVGVDVGEYGHSDVARHDPRVIAVVECLGLKNSSGGCADLRIATIEGDRYRIDEYDGSESVMEPDDYEWIKV